MPAKRRACLLVVGIVLVLVLPASAAAQTSSGSQPSVEAAVTNCFKCHAQTDLGTLNFAGLSKDLHIDEVGFKASAHGFLTCDACHIGFGSNPHQMVASVEFFAQQASEACRNCHDEQYQMYRQSYHGKLARNVSTNGERPPECVDCHGSHSIQKVSALELRQSEQELRVREVPRRSGVDLPRHVSRQDSEPWPRRGGYLRRLPRLALQSCRLRIPRPPFQNRIFSRHVRSAIRPRKRSSPRSWCTCSPHRVRRRSSSSSHRSSTSS